MVRHPTAHKRLPLLTLLLAVLLAGGIGTGLAQNEPETAVSDLPCATLAAYAADLGEVVGEAPQILAAVRTSSSADDDVRNVHELIAAREALRTCIDAHGFAAATP